MTIKTPLYEEHKRLKAKLVDFAGFMMPISYASVLKEHEAVRHRVGIFDISHMGEIFVSGPDAATFLNYLTINDVVKLKPGHAQYSAFLNEQGGFIDDIIIYQLETNRYMICVNAANIQKDFDWITSHKTPQHNIIIENASSQYAQLAIQGPLSPQVVALLLSDEEKQQFLSLGYMQHMMAPSLGQQALLARTGYTGELGYEIYLPANQVKELWQKVLSSGARWGIQPCGLGSRDILRLEAGYLLYGQDMDDKHTPWEAGIGWAVQLQKENFIGKQALLAQKQQGVTYQLVAFTMQEPGIARHDMNIFADAHSQQPIGKVTSGSTLPSCQASGGLCYIKTKQATINDQVMVDVRGKRKVALLRKRPLYQAHVKDAVNIEA